MFLFNDGLSLMINFNFNEKLGLVENCCYFSTFWILKNDLTSSYQSCDCKKTSKWLPQKRYYQNCSKSSNLLYQKYFFHYTFVRHYDKLS